MSWAAFRTRSLDLQSAQIQHWIHNTRFAIAQCYYAWSSVAISAILKRRCWRLDKGFPNCLRTVKCSLATSRHRWAPPKLQEAIDNMGHKRYPNAWTHQSIITNVDAATVKTPVHRHQVRPMIHGLSNFLWGSGNLLHCNLETLPNLSNDIAGRDPAIFKDNFRGWLAIPAQLNKLHCKRNWVLVGA